MTEGETRGRFGGAGAGGGALGLGGKGEKEGARNHVISLFGGESRHSDRVT